MYVPSEVVYLKASIFRTQQERIINLTNEIEHAVEEKYITRSVNLFYRSVFPVFPVQLHAGPAANVGVFARRAYATSRACLCWRWTSLVSACRV